MAKTLLPKSLNPSFFSYSIHLYFLQIATDRHGESIALKTGGSLEKPTPSVFFHLYLGELFYHIAFFLYFCTSKKHSLLC